VIEKLGYTAIMIGIAIYFVLLVAALLVDQRPRWRVSEWVTKYVLSRTRTPTRRR
jgi:UDP-N-acetylmuramyl pentapeptide phosphotransferase/UDP-N-acetylglucosamine-1-phosphate transferase